MLSTIDASDDKRLSLEELSDFINGKVPKDKIERYHVTKLFHSRDTSGDGKLDKEEFRALLADSGYSDTVIVNTIEAVAEEDGTVTLMEFQDQ